MSIDQLLANFASPPASHRPQPLWVWNGIVTRTWITQSLHDLHAQGCGGVFVHPRPGLITEYLSAEWFSLWRFAADECRRLGMECHIYDENSFPAGFAGGHVPATNPLTVASVLRGRIHTAPPLPAGETLVATYRVGQDHSLAPIDRQEIDEALQAGQQILSISAHREAGGLWQGGFPYVDLTLPATTRTFLNVTHDAYAKHIGEFFGNTCKYAFSDEPMLQPRGGIVHSAYLAAEFRREHGYDLESRLGDLTQPTDTGREVRFDYQLTVQRLFETHFAAEMNRACEAMGLKFTGHFMEHEWPSPSSHPSAMSLLRHMPVPGNDLLGFQFDAAKPHTHNAVWQLNLTELRSVAAQTGAERVLTETCGGGGYNYTLRDFKACEDFALVGGVTLVNPHLVHQTLTGARRYDWAQTISPHAPWYDGYRQQTDHVARVQTALLAGKHVSRVLVLMPTTSAWLEFVPASFRLPNYVDKLPAIRDCQTALVQLLASYAIDYDLGDELILRDLGSVANRRLRVGQSAYDVIVIPEAMANVLPSTLALLGEFASQGGHILALADHYTHIAGRRPAGRDTRWTSLGTTATRVSRDGLIAELQQRCPPAVQPVGGPLPVGVLHLAKTADTGEVIHFFTNPYDTHTEAHVLMRAEAVVELDTSTGLPARVSTEPDGPMLRLRLQLPPRSHRLLLSGPASPLPAPRASAPPATREIRVHPRNVRRAEPNLLVLDYCDVTSAGGASAHSVPCITADRIVWKDHGQPQNLWRWAIQYRRTYLETTFPEPSGFELTYRFHADPGTDLASLQLALERPHLYDLSLNGTPISSNSGTRYFDGEMFALALRGAAQVGDNRLTIRARQMNCLCEVTPPLLIGNFRVDPADTGFRLRPETPLAPGLLLSQGLPFYNRGVLHTFDFDLDADTTRLTIDPGDWNGSVLGASIDNGPNLYFTSPGQSRVWDSPLSKGRHTLTLDLRGHFRNQMGPWHAEGLPIPWAWENAPSPQPPGEKYKLSDWGLTGQPRLWG